jgi:hypothetical protein
MQKIQSYLYPNRIIVTADLAGFTTEYKNVYQRNVKIYNGVDNVIEFDIKNADQKRINLTTLKGLKLNVMDSQGNALSKSPYTLTPTTLTGIAKTVIPVDDLLDLSAQYLKYSITALDSDLNTVVLYTDSRFGAVGTMELVGDAMPTIKDDLVLTDFTQEINFMGNVINHSSAIPCKFYEAEKTSSLIFEIEIKGFKGEIYLEGTTDMTISVNSYLNATHLYPTVIASPTSTTIQWYNVPVSEFNYFRVSWVNSSIYNVTSTNPSGAIGSVEKITISS